MRYVSNMNINYAIKKVAIRSKIHKKLVSNNGYYIVINILMYDMKIFLEERIK